jgi:hypothetical protein
MVSSAEFSMIVWVYESNSVRISVLAGSTLELVGVAPALLLSLPKTESLEPLSPPNIESPELPDVLYKDANGLNVGPAEDTLDMLEKATAEALALRIVEMLKTLSPTLDVLSWIIV